MKSLYDNISIGTAHQKALYDASECIESLAWDLAFDRAIREGLPIREAAKRAEKEYREYIPAEFRYLV